MKQSSPETAKMIRHLTTILSILFCLLPSRVSAFGKYDGWRITLNIGREPGTFMDGRWAASGARLPVTVPCDFHEDGNLVPKEDTVEFTITGGAVQKAVESGNWDLKDNRHLTFTLGFPDGVAKNDVSLPAGAKVTCKGLLYTLPDLQELNEHYYAARDESWKAEETVTSIGKRREAPKKWNPVKQQWEKRYSEEPLWGQVTKKFDLWKAQQEENRRNSQRPDPNSLSLDNGPFPGLESYVHIVKDGKMTIQQGVGGNTVVGRWSAEPISDKPVSYRRSAL
eukprot:CAMPEP_0194033596 /NCGR_PEP_ID=MMETSP0009_2-20130614/6226_1 /TAXON_ID=210454 /ORGANISM="Grammatophora oceanica, Strain CCMP 410" /LENGTH=280 /DNA_ID=CAMNT_0038674311 /DNA_START=115 /DNA_END=957 /DNA_ORIENTATION=+